MDRREQIAHLAATREEEMLLVRVCEKLDTAVQRDIPAATNFLSKREQMLVCEVLRGAPIRFFGGLSTAEREISCYLPDYLDEDWLTGEDGPVAAVRAAFFERDSLSHRDFLGALMGCGIKRETVGDIYVATGRCDFLVTRDILPYVLQNLTDAGRTRLHLEQIPLSALEAPEQKTKQIRGTVSSLRLDGVVAEGFALSRSRAAEVIAAGKTELNYTLCAKPDRLVAEGDVISVRGLGKMRLEAVGGNTKKGGSPLRSAGTSRRLLWTNPESNASTSWPARPRPRV